MLEQTDVNLGLRGKQFLHIMSIFVPLGFSVIAGSYVHLRVFLWKYYFRNAILLHHLVPFLYLL